MRKALALLLVVFLAAVTIALAPRQTRKARLAENANMRQVRSARAAAAATPAPTPGEMQREFLINGPVFTFNGWAVNFGTAQDVEACIGANPLLPPSHQTCQIRRAIQRFQNVTATQAGTVLVYKAEAVTSQFLDGRRAFAMAVETTF